MPKVASSEVQRTVLGLGVPVAPSFLVLDDEETKAYDVREAQGVSLSALLAECQDASQPVQDSSAAGSTTIAKIDPRGSLPTVPRHPNDSYPEIRVTGAESSSHPIEEDLIEEAPARSNSQGPNVDQWVKAWSKPPEPISMAPAALPRPSRRRSFFSKFLFAMITLAIATLLVYELTATGKMPWLDPRPHWANGIKFAKEKIPWDRLPKLPRL